MSVGSATPMMIAVSAPLDMASNVGVVIATRYLNIAMRVHSLRVWHEDFRGTPTKPRSIPMARER
jgi:hypothetical protein